MNDTTGVATAAPPTHQFGKSRITLLKFLIICLPLWLSAKFYTGPYHEQVGLYLAGIFYLICWALLIQIVLPRLRETPLLIALFLVFCAVELLAWQAPELLQGVSVTLDNRIVIGAHYSLNKIPYYGVGAFICYFILKACRSN
ncbi:MAG: DUF2809 domain-containing protein [Desulfofustis sp.]|jgi:hypothetical protein|nr:DUF2809 domain-containing protein [Desulfofustis sp.]